MLNFYFYDPLVRLPDASAAIFHFLDMQGKTDVWRRLLSDRQKASISTSLSNEEGDKAKRVRKMAQSQKWIYFNMETPVVTEKWLWDQQLKQVHFLNLEKGLLSFQTKGDFLID